MKITGRFYVDTPLTMVFTEYPVLPISHLNRYSHPWINEFYIDTKVHICQLLLKIGLKEYLPAFICRHLFAIPIVLLADETRK
jgi:hypothetical protein